MPHCRPRASACLLVLASAFALAHASPPEFGRQTWHSENGLPQNTVHAILQARSGYLWVGTEGGLARFDGIRFAVYNTQNTPQLQSNNIRQLLETRDGSLWIATAEGITRLENGRFTFYGTRDGLPNNNVLSLREDSSGTLWADTAAGAARLSGNGSTSQVFDAETEPRPSAERDCQNYRTVPLETTEPSGSAANPVSPES